jgi:hypothetical protein
VWRLAVRQPAANWLFAKLFVECVVKRQSAVHAVGMLTTFYIHVEPFSRYVMAVLDRQIEEIDSGARQPPLVDATDTDAGPHALAPSVKTQSIGDDESVGRRRKGPRRQALYSCAASPSTQRPPEFCASITNEKLALYAGRCAHSAIPSRK